MIKNYSLVFLAFLCFSLSGFGQVKIAELTFETPGDYTTSVTEFSDGSLDYFTRTDGTNISSSISFTNVQGSYYFAAHDIDGEVSSPIQSLFFTGINISGYTTLEVRIHIAEDDDGNNQDWDAADYFHLNGKIDTGGSQNLIWVESSGGTNTTPAIDTDYNGTGDSTQITDAFAQFTKSIAGTGTNLDLELIFNLDSGDEDIAIDNIEIWGVSAGPTTYSITYNGNSNTGGTTPTDSNAYDSGDTVTVLGNTGSLVNTCNAFNGWNTASDGSGTSYVATDTFNITANTILYAQWLPTGNTVTFNSNGGTGTMSPQTNCVAENLTANTFTNAGFTFNIWNTAVNGSGTSYAEGASYDFSADITLYAQWDVFVGPCFTMYGKDFPNTSGYTTNDGNAKRLASGGTGGSISTDPLSGVSGDITVEFNAEGWDDNENEVTVTLNGVSQFFSTITDDSFNVYTATFTGVPANSVLEFSTDSGKRVLIELVEVFCAASTPSHTITFNGNGNTGGTMADQTINEGASENLTTNTFIRTGYMFDGWSTTSGGAVVYADNASYTMGTSDVTLYAQWSIGNYTVSYDGNGNTGGTAPAANNGNYNTSITLPGVGSLVRTGFAFNGWNTATNGSGTHYNAGASYTIGSANTTLYAEWLSTSPPNVTSALTAIGDLVNAFTYTITASNAPTSFNATGLPPGLSINTSTGEISGNPTVTGTYNVTISATNAYGTDTETLVITINDAPACNPPIWEENFDYGCEDAADISTTLAFPNWSFQSNGTDPLKYSATGLTYASYASSGIGGSAQYQGGGDDDIKREIKYADNTYPASGNLNNPDNNLFVSFLINMTNLGSSDYFVSLIDGSNNYYSRVYARNSGSGYQIGIVKYTGTIQWSSVLDYNKTYLLVLKNEFVVGTVNDVLKLWIIESGLPVSESLAGSATLQAITNDTDPAPASGASIRNFMLRQSGKENGVVDGIRVATNWEDLLCPVPTTALYYRSKDVGPSNWANSCGWESSPDNVNWSNSTSAPTKDANTITIRPTHTVYVESSISLDQTVIEGTLELRTGSELNINDGTGDDIKIESGGLISVKNNSGDYTSIFYQDPDASIHVGSNGKIEIIGGVSAVPGNMGNLASNVKNVWDDGSIYEWNSTVGTPDGSGITYFPNSDNSTIPIFRISALYSGDDTIGGSFPLIVNGLIDAKVDITFKSSGTKDFRNGFIGSNVTITFLDTLGTLTMSGPSAELSGTLNIVLNKTLNLTNGANVPTGSLVIIDNGSSSNIAKLGGVFNVETNAIFDIGTNCTMSNTSGSVDVSGTFRTGNTNGFTGTLSSLPTIGGVLNLSTNSTIELNRNDGTPQNLTARNDFKNLTFSGSGIKTISSGFNPNGLVYITDNATLDVSNFTFGNSLTNLTMDMNSRFRISGIGTKPDITGDYDLQAGVVEFYNSGTALTENIRGTSGGTIEYYQIEVTGDMVGNSNANITLQDNGIFTVKSTGVFEINNNAIVGPTGTQTVRVENGGVFKTGDVDGFNGGTGAVATSVRNDVEIIILEAGSTVEYSRIGDQTLTDFNSNADPSNDYYANLTISGTGTKQMGANDGIIIGEDLNVIASELYIDNSKFVQVEDNAVIAGAIKVETKGAFVQVDDAGTFSLSGSGTATANKVSASKNTLLDYTYWSSPITAANLNTLFSAVPVNRRYKYNAANYRDEFMEALNDNTQTLGQDDIDDNGDDWQLATGIMTPGQGYAFTGPTFVGGFPYVDDIDFTGEFNTGDITIPIYENGFAPDNDWNLIGNPYPSALDFSAFHTKNNSLVEGVAYLWSHYSALDNTNNGNEGYNFNQDDYAIINVGSGGTAGSSGIIPQSYIPSGQSFFIVGTATGNAVFKNAMRKADGTSNNQFFRSNEPQNEANKLWLNLTSDNGIFNQVLIAYVHGATDNFDSYAYDAPRNLSSGTAAIIYTKIEDSPNKNFAIQGKHPNSLTLDEVIPLGFYTSIDVPTIYTFSIAQFEGEFMTSNPIYVLDKLKNITHNLKDSDYTFTSETGEFNDRFDIVFTPTTLSIDDNIMDANEITITELQNGDVQIKVGNTHTIKHVAIIDVTGRVVYNLQGNDAIEVYDLSKLSQAAYIAKITLSNGQVISKKAIKRH
ncbi:InlB B-repeat-containing protein [Winogradskyella thalassocola]|uniref:Listeria/Bacterioides repeat-containing protein n=1 Tax=Winogradskyella thalassocola TaxID=262004 RepID=A0A1G7W5R5_9FLAO|nr:InlB B-repeat-containing protein [Winogradskyella thalassocola]SDG67317.1 Listeria/Bacterioides repeat-containing protein [Winogradskyella thalassocola]